MPKQTALLNTSPAIAGEAVDQPNEKVRSLCVYARLNQAEMDWLDEARSSTKMSRSSYMRLATMDKLPPVIPAINQKAWIDLSRAAGNLNQMQRDINKGLIKDHNQELLLELKNELTRVRRLLIKSRWNAGRMERKNEG